MPSDIVTCPICKKQYRLPPGALNDLGRLAQRTFTCTNCRYVAPFSSIIKGLPRPQVNPGRSAVTRDNHAASATRVSPAVGMRSSAHLTILATGTKLVLNQGAYILGRKSSDSTATLQLAPDISMSRQHARLAVQTVGGRVMAQIVGLKADNPVIINGRMLAAGQSYMLKPGDRIQLGMTHVLFTV